MTAATLTLTEFLLARIAEDEAVAQAVYDEQGRQLAGASIVPPDPREPYVFPVELENGFQVLGVAPFARLAECGAKRRIVERHSPREFFHPGGSQVLCRACSDDWPCADLRDLALPYADHPDYRQEWRP